MTDPGAQHVGGEKRDTVLSLNPVQAQLLEKTPFVGFLGIELIESSGELLYQLTFRDQHIGNPLLRTFHGGILASFGEISAALHVTGVLGLDGEPYCDSMTFDYLRPAFAGTLRAVPRIIRSGKRFIIVSVDIYLDQTLVSIGRFIYTRKSAIAG
jgi:uncharacterized protein (TIGR00369 family)